MATSTLKAVILVAVVVVGVLVLRSAFPDNVSEGISPVASSPTSPTASPTPTISPSPSPSPAPDRNPRKKRTTVQVLNGTDTDFFAATWSEVIKADGWKLSDPCCENGPTTQTTTIFYRPQFLVEAQALQNAFFPRAALEEKSDIDPAAVKVQILLGADAPEPSPG
jgi:hypothetical protein